MLHHTLPVPRTAHYFTLGTPGPHIRQYWLVCHGYAQLADEFLENFRLLDNGERYIVAPEGLNNFYKKGFAGDVTATWMTRRYRELAIADYANYLQLLHTQCLAQLPADVRVVLLGFSQGTATVCRWALAQQPHFHDLLLWSGMPPEDLNYGAQREYLADKNLYLLYGTSDPFLTPDHLKTVEAIEIKNDLDFQENPFVGGHDIPPEELRRFLERMN